MLEGSGLSKSRSSFQCFRRLNPGEQGPLPRGFIAACRSRALFSEGCWLQFPGPQEGWQGGPVQVVRRWLFSRLRQLCPPGFASPPGSIRARAVHPPLLGVWAFPARSLGLASSLLCSESESLLRVWAFSSRRAGVHPSGSAQGQRATQVWSARASSTPFGPGCLEIWLAGAVVPGPAWESAKHPFKHEKEGMMFGVSSLPCEEPCTSQAAPRAA